MIYFTHIFTLLIVPIEDNHKVHARNTSYFVVGMANRRNSAVATIEDLVWAPHDRELITNIFFLDVATSNQGSDVSWDIFFSYISSV
jgi:hypothetical protein